MMRLFGVTVLLVSTAGFVLAGTTTPEIDPSSGAAAFALLAGGLMVLRARRKKS